MGSYTFRKFVFVRPNYEKEGSENWSHNWKGYMKFYGSSPQKLIAGFEVSIMEGPKGLWAQVHGSSRFQVKHHPSIMKAVNSFVGKYEGRIREFFDQEALVETYPCRKEVVIHV